MIDKITTYSFCDSFIDRLADDIVRYFLNPARDLGRLAVVFGGRRPALFLNRELAGRIGDNFYPPRYFTIDEFVQYALKKKEMFKPVRDIDQCYLIYQLAQRHAPQILVGRTTFAQFLPWTREILAFIDQLDLEDVEDKQLLNIQANAAIGYDVPEDINRLLGHIVILRRFYNDEMKKINIYSRGFQYRRAMQVIEETRFEEFDSILFCNFFYLNRCEEKIIKALYERGQARLIFQGDQRKWPILARIAKDFSVTISEGAEIPTPTFGLNLYKAFDVHSAVSMAREILKKIPQPEKTVVVLPNADCLVPLVSEIAGLVKEFNVSMGYPLRRSSLYSLGVFIFKTQLSKKDNRYYARDYLQTLRHPFVKNLRFSDAVPAAVTRTLIHKIEEILTGKLLTVVSGSLFVALEEMVRLDDLYILTIEALQRSGIKATRRDLEQALTRIHGLLFTDWETLRNFKEFVACLKRFLDTFLEMSFIKKYPLNLNISARMYEVMDELRTVNFCSENFSQEEIFKIFDGKIIRELVSFRGSPLRGLQILGLFETRSLNFENVIVLDVNEGSLPKLNVYEPLIPREVMVSLNLDRLELEEEIQRYQFMRLLSSAKDVHLIYQEGKDKEKSRFVEELIWEEQKRHCELNVLEASNANFTLKVSARRTVIPKTPATMERLRTMRYSASSINAYVRNPVEFYYNYVLGLKEKEDLLDEPQARQLGTFIHELLEEGFRPFLGRKPKIDSAFRAHFAKIFEERFETTLARSMKSDAFMLKAIMTQRLDRFLDNEETSDDRRVEEILHLESRFEETISLSCGDIRLTYVIDRVDRMKDGTRMIVDYKTGTTDLMPKALDKIAALEWTRELVARNIRSFQIPLYFHYMDKVFSGQPVNAALYNLRTLKFEKFMDDSFSCPRKEINVVFLRALDFVIGEILNPKIDFESDEDFIIGART